MAIPTSFPDDRPPGSHRTRRVIELALIAATMFGLAGLWRHDPQPQSAPASGQVQLSLRLDGPALVMNILWGGRR
jgi:hypothetical protein